MIPIPAGPRSLVYPRLEESPSRDPSTKPRSRPVEKGLSSRIAPSRLTPPGKGTALSASPSSGRICKLSLTAISEVIARMGFSASVTAKTSPLSERFRRSLAFTASSAVVSSVALRLSGTLAVVRPMISRRDGRLSPSRITTVSAGIGL